MGLGLSDPCVTPCNDVFSPVIRRGLFFLELAGVSRIVLLRKSIFREEV